MTGVEARGTHGPGAVAGAGAELLNIGLLRGMLVVLLCLLRAALAQAQADSVSRSWNQPVRPFRIIDRIYYVGASDITSYLIKTDSGLIVIDGGLVETAPQILQNIRALGYKPSDVKILLISHPHYDHVGGVAALKKATGARLLASVADAEMLARGGLNDFGFGDTLPFPAVKADSTFADGAIIALGGVKLKANITPGHTRGCTTWTMTVHESGLAWKLSGAEHAPEYGALFLCSTSVPGYQLVGNSKYPDIVKDYEKSFARLRTMRCDVFLGAHGSFFGLTSKREVLKKGGNTNPFIDPDGCRAYLEWSEQSFRRIVEQQRGG